MLNKIKQAVNTAKEVVIIAPRMLTNKEFSSGVNRVLARMNQAATIRKISMNDLKIAYRKEKASINAIYREAINNSKDEFQALAKKIYKEERANRKKELRKKAVKKAVKKVLGGKLCAAH